MFYVVSGKAFTHGLESCGKVYTEKSGKFKFAEVVPPKDFYLNDNGGCIDICKQFFF